MNWKRKIEVDKVVYHKRRPKNRYSYEGGMEIEHKMLEENCCGRCKKADTFPTYEMGDQIYCKVKGGYVNPLQTKMICFKK